MSLLPATLLAAAALAFQPAGEPHPGDAAKGRVLAADRCGLCHATTAKGANPLRKAPPFRDLPRKYDVEGLAEALAEGISVGDARMPEHVLKPVEIDDLLAYIRTLGRPRR